MYLTHGMTKSPEYAAWVNMRGRCLNPNNPGWHRYGGRGITICPEWEISFDAFLRDVGRRPAQGYSIDRIDNDGPYAPGNIRWADRRTQQQNTRRQRYLTYQGVTLCVSEWARRMCVDRHLLQGRLKRGWPVERVLAGADIVVPDPERSMSFA